MIEYEATTKPMIQDSDHNHKNVGKIRSLQDEIVSSRPQHDIQIDEHLTLLTVPFRIAQ